MYNNKSNDDNLLREVIGDYKNDQNVTRLSELSNVKNSNGHYYLNIKDNNSLIRGIIWRSKLSNGDKFKDGDKVELEGHLDFYSKGEGTLQKGISEPSNTYLCSLMRN